MSKLGHLVKSSLYYKRKLGFQCCGESTFVICIDKTETLFWTEIYPQLTNFILVTVLLVDLTFWAVKYLNARYLPIRKKALYAFKYCKSVFFVHFKIYQAPL